MGIGAVPQRKDILQTGLRAGHSKASRADLNFTNALREGLFLLALARAAPIARRLVPIWRRPKDRDLMMRPERADPLPCPAIAVAGHQAVPVEDVGDQIIIGDENQLADGGQHVGGDAVALSAAAPRQAQFGMNAANPMGQENDL